MFSLCRESFGSWKQRETDPFKEFPWSNIRLYAESELYCRACERADQYRLADLPSARRRCNLRGCFLLYFVAANSRFQRAMIDSGLTVGADIAYTQRNVGPIYLNLVTTAR